MLEEGKQQGGREGTVTGVLRAGTRGEEMGLKKNNGGGETLETWEGDGALSRGMLKSRLEKYQKTHMREHACNEPGGTD